jgi:hypothetical protein
MFDTRPFEFKIDSVGNAGESISVTADIVPIVVFGQMDTLVVDPKLHPELSYFDMNLYLSFEKSDLCSVHRVLVSKYLRHTSMLKNVK